MSKFTKDATRRTKIRATGNVAVGITHDPNFKATIVPSYEGNSNYTVDPIASLRLILASSIFGEPAFYESDNERVDKTVKAIDAALSYDFDATLRLAAELREKSWMRLNPQIIYVRAAMHPSRVAYTDTHAGMFDSVMRRIALRPDDITTQVEYYISVKGDKAKMPGILKRAAAKRLGEFEAYHILKYANRGIGLVDVTRILHATSEPISKLMKGELTLAATERTWKEMRSAGATWQEILDSGVSLSHSDLLYNMRGIVSEVSASVARKIAEKFISGVSRGNIWPSKYYTAYETINSGPDFPNKVVALQAFSRAVETRIEANKLDRVAAVLIDGSASMTWGGTIEAKSPAVIAALSGAITAKQYAASYMVPFATSTKFYTVDNTRSVLDLMKEADAQKFNLGGGTEMGRAIRELITRKVVVDDIYIYSDTQATGGVEEAIKEYRRKINPKVNVAIIQVAGYDNSVLPNGEYRTVNLSSWTGKETDYLLEVDAIWNGIEAR
jgi:hypothetical protein